MPINNNLKSKWIKCPNQKTQNNGIDKKHDPNICCIQETHLRTKDIHKVKVKGWKKIFQRNGQEKKAKVAILISDKIDLKKRAIKRDPEGHFIILKGRIPQEDINIVNIYAPNIRSPNT